MVVSQRCSATSCTLASPLDLRTNSQKGIGCLDVIVLWLYSLSSFLCLVYVFRLRYSTTKPNNYSPCWCVSPPWQLATIQISNLVVVRLKINYKPWFDPNFCCESMCLLNSSVYIVQIRLLNDCEPSRRPHSQDQSIHLIPSIGF